MTFKELRFNIHSLTIGQNHDVKIIIDLMSPIILISSFHKKRQKLMQYKFTPTGMYVTHEIIFFSL